MAYTNYKKPTTIATDGNGEVKNEVAKTNGTMEELLSSDAVISLAKSLRLNQAQIAKGNSLIIKLACDDKLKYCKTMSKIRYAYQAMLLNYKNQNALCGVPMDGNVQLMLQYDAFIEDMQDNPNVEDVGWARLYKGQKYPTFINSADCKEIKEFPKLEFDDPFTNFEVIGYYCYCKCKNGKTYTCIKSVKDCEDWATKYSISYRKFKNGEAKSAIWHDQWDTMCLKTVVKAVGRMVNRVFPTDRMSKALELDQAVFDEVGMTYADNPQNKTNNNIDCQVKNTLQPKEEVDIVDVKDIPVDNPQN